MKAKKCLQILGEIKDVAFAAVDKNGMPANPHHQCDACRRRKNILLHIKEQRFLCTVDARRKCCNHGNKQRLSDDTSERKSAEISRSEIVD